LQGTASNRLWAIAEGMLVSFAMVDHDRGSGGKGRPLSGLPQLMHGDRFSLVALGTWPDDPDLPSVQFRDVA
jgi:hypothetical protein